MSYTQWVPELKRSELKADHLLQFSEEINKYLCGFTSTTTMRLYGNVK